VPNGWRERGHLENLTPSRRPRARSGRRAGRLGRRVAHVARGQRVPRGVPGLRGGDRRRRGAAQRCDRDTGVVAGEPRPGTRGRRPRPRARTPARAVRRRRDRGLDRALPGQEVDRPAAGHDGRDPPPGGRRPRNPVYTGSAGPRDRGPDRRGAPRRPAVQVWPGRRGCAARVGRRERLRLGIAHRRRARRRRGQGAHRGSACGPPRDGARGRSSRVCVCEGQSPVEEVADRNAGPPMQNRSWLSGTIRCLLGSLSRDG